jgi:hypothetical protein
MPLPPRLGKGDAVTYNDSMLAESALVLTIDRLGAGFLGPYGNTWIETPAFNRLASQALLCETALSDSPHLEAAFRAYWTGLHAAQPAASQAGATSPPSLPARARAAGAATILVTDEPALAGHPLAGDFSERIVVPLSPSRLPAAGAEETQLAKLMQAAIDLLPNLPYPFLLWVHARGMGGEWDAPTELRRQFASEDDPLPGNFVEPPEQLLEANADPDDLLKLVHAYGGQVTLADLCLGALLAALDEQDFASRTLLVVTAPRGYPLGEHRRIGPCDGALYGELLQVPLLVRAPANVGALVRAHELVQPGDLHALIGQACGWSAGQATGILAAILNDEPHAPRELAVAVSENERAIRTAGWFLREARLAGEWQRELFVKPDDRWEVNEVASRGGEVPELLSDALARFLTAAAAGTLADLPPLDERLREVWQ